MSKKFIDISEHNTILSFDRLKTANLAGVIMKATEGTTYIDHAHDIYYDGLKGAVPIGYYHFLTSTSEPENQAQNFYKQIKDKQYQIIPILDVEQDSLGYKAQDFTERFMKEFYQLSGQNMIIYSGRYFINDHFDVSFRNDNVWWVADYSASVVPTILGCRIVAWQYTESCRDYDFALGGIDCNILVNDEYFYIEDIEIPFSDDTTLIDEIENIMILQRELNNQGFTDFQWQELDVDGFSGERTLSACPTLSIGAKGNITKWVQQKMGITADGIFGEQTRQAVIKLQTNNCLTRDGIIGKKTWRKLLGM